MTMTKYAVEERTVEAADDVKIIVGSNGKGHFMFDGRPVRVREVEDKNNLQKCAGVPSRVEKAVINAGFEFDE